MGMGAATLLDHLVLVGAGAIGAEIALTHPRANGVLTPLKILAGVVKAGRVRRRCDGWGSKGTRVHVAALRY